MKLIPALVHRLLEIIRLRLAGSKPGVLKAQVTSIAIAVAAGVVMYKLQRGGA